MAISVHCASCGQVFAANDTLAGRRVRCRQCGAAISVPAPDATYALADPLYGDDMSYPLAAELPPANPLGLGLPAAHAGYGGRLQSSGAYRPRGSTSRRKQNSNVQAWLAVAGGTLFGLAIFIAILVATGTGAEGWLTLLTAPRRERSKIRPITAPAEDPFAKAAQQRAAPLGPPPPYTGPSPEPTLQQLLAVVHRMNGALAAIHDEASARQRSQEIVGEFRKMGAIVQSSDADFPDLPVAEANRLKAIYEPQFQAAADQTKHEFERIKRIPEAGRVLARSLQFEDLRFHAFRRPWTSRTRRATVNRHLASLSMPPDNSDPFARYAEREVVEIEIRDVPPGVHDFVFDRIRALAQTKSASFQAVNSTMRVTIAPVKDIRALAAQIDFGRVVVLDVSQSLMVVKVDFSRTSRQ